MRLFGRRSEEPADAGSRFLIVGLGNPGERYARTRHNVGFRVVTELAGRWDLSGGKDKYRARIAEGRTRPGGARVVLMTPQTYMNESGSAVGPARGQLRVPLDRVIVVHDEIDLPFGEIRSKLGGGVAGHNGLKSLKQGLGDAEFWRVRTGVGRPDSTDPEIVSAYVLGRFSEPEEEVAGLVSAAADEVEALIERLESE